MHTPYEQARESERNIHYSEDKNDCDSRPLSTVTIHIFDPFGDNSDRDDMLGEKNVEMMARHEWDDDPFAPGTGDGLSTSTRQTIIKR